jgi:hypothetical protein
VKIRDDGLIAVAALDYETTGSGGVHLFDGANWTVWTTANSPLTSWQVEALEFDRDGHLWISATIHGVCQVLIGEMPVAADVTGDGVVDVDDLIAVILAWGPCPAPPAACPADTNTDGVVDVDDLIAVILNWD